MGSQRRTAGRRADDPSAAGSPSEHLPEVLQFMRLLWALVHQLQKRSKRMAAELGVTGPQRLVLRVVGLMPGASAGTLAAVLHVHPSTLTGVLQRLVDQRLLRRLSDARDRRRAVLHLTSRGERINATSNGTVEAAVATALRGLGRRDAAAAERALTVIAEHLQEPPSPRVRARTPRPRPIRTSASRRRW